jgi:hypothetical protein
LQYNECTLWYFVLKSCIRVQGIESRDRAHDGTRLLMAVCSATATKKPELRESAKEMATEMYSKLFEWAEAENQLPALTNELLVNLKLIKVSTVGVCNHIRMDNEIC